MITLVSSRYGVKRTGEHDTFERAAIEAVFEVEFNSAYPIEIRDGDVVLWQNKSEGMGKLQQLAIANGYGYLFDD